MADSTEKEPQTATMDNELTELEKNRKTGVSYEVSTSVFCFADLF